MEGFVELRSSSVTAKLGKAKKDLGKVKLRAKKKHPAAFALTTRVKVQPLSRKVVPLKKRDVNPYSFDPKQSRLRLTNPFPESCIPSAVLRNNSRNG